jgi:ankyrin repeat protein
MALHDIVQHLSNRGLDLIDQLADINEVDDNGRTALHYAALYDRPIMVAHLLNEGASDTLVDRFSLTPFLIAWAKGHIACACLLAMANPGIVDFQDPFWRSSNPTRSENPFTQLILERVLDLLRQGINIWAWTQSALGCDLVAQTLHTMLEPFCASLTDCFASLSIN